MKAMVIGSGHVGCGFAGQLLSASGYEVLFVARDPILTQHLNRVGSYRVRLLRGTETSEISVQGIRAISSADPDLVAQEMATADLVVTSVGAPNLPCVAPLIAAGLLKHDRPLNVFAFENLADAGPQLRRLVSEHLPADFPLDRHGFSGALVSRAVTERLGDPAGDELLTFVGDPPINFVVDGPSLRSPLPQVVGMIVTDDYAARLQNKLYIFSAGHATCAYLGYLKGYHYIHSAIRDPEIRAAVLAAMAEGQRGLAVRYGSQFAGDESDLQEIVTRFDNAALNDPVERVGRDPQRKLGAADRLVGAAQLAKRAGIHPEKLALAAAAAFCFCSPGDCSAVELQLEIEAVGLGPALRKVCGLDPTRDLGRFVADVWGRLAKGWRVGNQLVSLDKLLWAWSS